MEQILLMMRLFMHVSLVDVPNNVETSCLNTFKWIGNKFQSNHENPRIDINFRRILIINNSR